VKHHPAHRLFFAVLLVAVVLAPPIAVIVWIGDLIPPRTSSFALIELVGALAYLPCILFCVEKLGARLPHHHEHDHPAAG